MPEEPTRLKRPFPKAKSARSPFADGLLFVDVDDIKVVFVPIVQWGAIRIRGRIEGAAGVVDLAFARPARQKNPDDLPNAKEYTTSEPAASGTAWVDDVEFTLDITAAEHVGENWLRIALDPAAAAEVIFFDVMGTNLGQSS